MSEQQINEIINRYYSDKASDLAKEYHVSESRIAQIWMKNNKRGKDRRIYHLNNEDYFNVIDTGNKAYFVGFIAADGCLYNNENDLSQQKRIRISIHHKDKKILDIFNREIDTDKPIILYKTYANVEISSSTMFNDLLKIGLAPRKTYGNTIADIPPHLFNHFLRGYFDGDGSISKRENNNCETSRFTISIAGYRINMEKIQKYLEQLNILTTFIVDKRKNKYTQDNDFGSLTAPNRMAIYSFLKMIYRDSNGTYLDRKYELAKKFIDQVESSTEAKDRHVVIYYKYAVLPFIEKLDTNWRN